MRYHLLDDAKGAIPVVPLTAATLPGWLEGQEPATRAWVAANAFAARPESRLALPDGKGGVGVVLYGFDAGGGPQGFAALPAGLPEGSYRIEARLDAATASDIALGWGLATYAFDRYKKLERPKAKLVWPKGAQRDMVKRTLDGIFLVRDLINTPAEHMGPADLADAAEALAKKHKAKLKVTVGDELLKKNFPLIHAVGRAAAREPRLIDLTWGKGDLKVTLVGKGVCFDSGGLDLKSAEGMKLMKKDMGGAAHVLALAGMIMDAKLPVRLRVLVPAVENAVSGNAFRPLDVIRSRQGLTVEIGNTDAEGRLILADALALAVEDKPDLLLDFATLTGAARIALGTELPALFSNHDPTAELFLGAGKRLHDNLWRLPLWRPYRKLIDSKVADLNNAGEGGYGGSITAALFLQDFVPDQVPWAHLDLMAWNLAARPGRPVGGEAMGLRAAYAMIDALAGAKPARAAAGGKRRNAKGG